MAQEGKPISLEFTKPGSGGPYEEITWYKGSTGYSSNRIVLVHPDITGGQPLYYNDYCSGMSPCETSSKGELNITTGELTRKKNLFYFSDMDTKQLTRGTSFIHVTIQFIFWQVVTQTAIPLNVRLDKSAEITSVKLVREIKSYYNLRNRP